MISIVAETHQPDLFGPKYTSINRNKVVKLFDFSAYAKRREAQRKADEVEALKKRLNEPGVIDEFKCEVEEWLKLHQEVIKKAS